MVENVKALIDAAKRHSVGIEPNKQVLLKHITRGKDFFS